MTTDSSADEEGVVSRAAHAVDQASDIRPPDAPVRPGCAIFRAASGHL
ncbi:hypothetical protein [Arthrobacter sp. CAN_A2]